MSSQIEFIKNNTTEYKIIYPTNVSKNSAIITAVNEVIKYVKLSTGTEIKSCLDENIAFNKGLKVLSFGKTSVLKNTKITFDFVNYKHDCFYIKTIEQSVFIDGKSDRAILYGAYEFLERFVGIKFLAFDDTFIPKTSTIIIDNIDRVFNPDFNLRVFSSEPTMYDYEFMAHNRMIDEYVNIPENFGGNLGQFWKKELLEHPVHNSLYYVEPEKYQKEYDEWFCHDYKDKNYIADLCYSNVGLKEDGSIDESLSISPVKIIIERLKTFIENSDKEDKYFFFGQMDAGYDNICKCEKCLENEKKFGRSGMLIRLLNAVDTEIQKWLKEQNIDREIYLCTFAYQWSEMPPVKSENNKFVALDKTVIPNDNVIIRICTIRANQYYSVIDDKQFARTRDMINGWRSVLKNKRSMLWSYHSRFTYPFLYFPTMQHWKEDFNVYKEIGCEYIYMEPNHFEKNDWQAMMETYVASKVLWDTSLDTYQVREEYIKYYYGCIADLVREYIDNFEKHFEKLLSSDCYPSMALQGLDEILQAKFYPVDFWYKQFSLVEKMYKTIYDFDLTKDEKELYNNKIDRIKMTNESTVLYKFDDYKFDKDFKWTKDQLKNDFFRICDKLNVKKTGEWQSLEDLKKVWDYKGE